MREYFSVVVDQQGMLVGLPVIIANFQPNLDFLPRFILGIASHVDWEDEQTCFSQIVEELSLFYQVDDAAAVEHMLFPAIRACLTGQKKMTDDGIFQVIADLPDLYKIFERC